MIPILGCLLGVAIVLIGLQERRIAWLIGLNDRLLEANKSMVQATNKVIEMNDALVIQAKASQGIAEKAVDFAKEANSLAETAVKRVKELTP